MTSGSYRLPVTGVGDQTDRRLDLTGQVVRSVPVAKLVLTGGLGGVLLLQRDTAASGQHTGPVAGGLGRGQLGDFAPQSATTRC